MRKVEGGSPGLYGTLLGFISPRIPRKGEVFFYQPGTL